MWFEPLNLAHVCATDYKNILYLDWNQFERLCKCGRVY